MTMNRPQPRPGVLDIAPYVPGKSTAPGVAKVFKLSSNETPLGPSANAIAAYRATGEHLEDYPDGSAAALRDAIGAAFGLDPDRIVCGAGSDDLLNLLARAYLTDGEGLLGVGRTAAKRKLDQAWPRKPIAVGDVLRTTSLLPGLHRRWPGAHVTWVTSPAAAELFRGNPLGLAYTLYAVAELKIVQ